MDRGGHGEFTITEIYSVMKAVPPLFFNPLQCLPSVWYQKCKDVPQAQIEEEVWIAFSEVAMMRWNSYHVKLGSTSILNL